MYTLCMILKLFLHILRFLLYIYRKDRISTVFALVILWFCNSFYMSLQFKLKIEFSVLLGELRDPRMFSDSLYNGKTLYSMLESAVLKHFHLASS